MIPGWLMLGAWIVCAGNVVSLTVDAFRNSPGGGPAAAGVSGAAGAVASVVQGQKSPVANDPIVKAGKGIIGAVTGPDPSQTSANAIVQGVKGSGRVP